MVMMGELWSLWWRIGGGGVGMVCVDDGCMYDKRWMKCWVE